MIKQAAIMVVSVTAALGAARLASAVAASHGETGAKPAASASEPVESSADVPASSPAALSKSMDGHYWAEGEVDGRWVRFLVDTGASTVALTETDARRVGVNVEGLRYDFPIMTANGPAKAAPVVLSHVAVAGARVDGVPALVVREGLPTSLLGMSYLGRLSRFEATPSTLILRP